MIQIAAVSRGEYTTLYGLSNLGYVYAKDSDENRWNPIDPPIYPALDLGDVIEVPKVMRYSAIREKSAEKYFTNLMDITGKRWSEQEVYTDYCRWAEENNEIKAGKKLFRKTAIRMGWYEDGKYQQPGPTI